MFEKFNPNCWCIWLESRISFNAWCWSWAVSFYRSLLKLMIHLFEKCFILFQFSENKTMLECMHSRMINIRYLPMYTSAFWATLYNSTTFNLNFCISPRTILIPYAYSFSTYSYARNLIDDVKIFLEHLLSEERFDSPHTSPKQRLMNDEIMSVSSFSAAFSISARMSLLIKQLNQGRPSMLLTHKPSNTSSDWIPILSTDLFNCA